MGLGRWTATVIGAGLDAADQVQDAADLAGRVSRGVGRARWASAGLEDLRAAGGGRHAGVPLLVSGGVQVGNGIYHGDADRKVALEALDTGFLVLEAELGAAVHQRNAPALDQWWTIHVSPTIAEWRRFAQNERASWITRFATDWDAFEVWRDRLVRLRENARVQGIALASPEPPPLPQTITERGQSGAGSPLATLWTAVKVVLYAAVGVAGFVGLYTVVSDYRKAHLAAAPTAQNHEGENGSESKV